MACKKEYFINGYREDNVHTATNVVRSLYRNPKTMNFPKHKITEFDGSNLLDFADRISDIIWGSDLGWTYPTEEEGLRRLSEAVRDKYKIIRNVKSKLNQNASPD